MSETITKKDVITILEDIGKLLELKGETPFKSRAYYNAARNIAAAEEDINALIREEILRSFDFVIAADHSNFRMYEEDMNSRLIRALENKNVLQ